MLMEMLPMRSSPCTRMKSGGGIWMCWLNVKREIRKGPADRNEVDAGLKKLEIDSGNPEFAAFVMT